MGEGQEDSGVDNGKRKNFELEKKKKETDLLFFKGYPLRRIPTCDRCVQVGTPCTGVPSWACDGCTTHKKPCTLRGQGKRAPWKGKKWARTEDTESEDEVEDAVGPLRWCGI